MKIKFRDSKFDSLAFTVAFDRQGNYKLSGISETRICQVYLIIRFDQELEIFKL